MKRRTLLQLSAGAATLSAPAIARDRRSETLLFVPASNLTTPDPVWTTAAVVHTHAFLIYDTLFGLDGKGLPQPQMLAGHTVEGDGRIWTFTLRDGLRFHDGEPVRAIDALTSVRRWARRDTVGQQFLAQVQDATALDDKRFRFTLNAPFPLLTYALAANNCFVMPERVARTDPFQKITEYVGSGPWRFALDEWDAGVRAVYTRFPSYPPRPEPADFTSGGKIAHFERVEWQVLPDPATAAAALEAGEIDWLEHPIFDLLDQLRANSGVQVGVFNPLGRIGLIALNHLYPPFDKPEIRRAVLAAVDQSQFVAAVVGPETEYGQTGVGYFTQGSPFANTDGLAVLSGSHDPVAAQNRIRAAGYSGEPVLVMGPADMPDLQSLAQVTASLFKAIGLNIRYESMDWGSMLTRRANQNPPGQGGWNAFCTTWTGLGMSNPASNTPLRGNGRQAWSGWPTLPDLEQLRSAFFSATDLPNQQAIARQIQRAAVDGVPYVPVGQWEEPTAMRRDLSGLVRTSLAVFWGLHRA
jgi:peptide/nickel transport system substrate-binding protein